MPIFRSGGAGGGGGGRGSAWPSKPSALKERIAEEHKKTASWAESYTPFVAEAASFMADAAFIHQEGGQHPLVCVMRDGSFRLLSISLIDPHTDEVYLVFDVVFSLLGIPKDPVIGIIDLMVYEWEMSKLDAERGLSALDVTSRTHLEAIEWRKLADFYASQLPPCDNKEDLYDYCSMLIGKLATGGDHG